MLGINQMNRYRKNACHETINVNFHTKFTSRGTCEYYGLLPPFVLNAPAIYSSTSAMAQTHSNSFAFGRQCIHESLIANAKAIVGHAEGLLHTPNPTTAHKLARHSHWFLVLLHNHHHHEEVRIYHEISAL